MPNVPSLHPTHAATGEERLPRIVMLAVRDRRNPDEKPIAFVIVEREDHVQTACCVPERRGGGRPDQNSRPARDRHPLGLRVARSFSSAAG